ncbi:hypothetical protein CHISP_2684 [Chitinispirillum alkaliphilum]|nr:hypothetical protein CHISP_2684 [Chitinispirillum alkaliphilum]
MRRVWKQFLMFCLSSVTGLSLIVTGCAYDNVAGGSGGTDYPNTRTITGKVQSCDGLPLNNGLVYVVEGSEWLTCVYEGKSEIVDSTRTASDGSFVVRVPEHKVSNLQIMDLEEALLVKDISSYPDYVERFDFKLKPGVDVSGKVQHTSVLSSEIRLSGSSYRTTVGPDGRFLFRNVPEGEYIVLTGADVGGAAEQTIGATLIVDSENDLENFRVHSNIDKVLIDNFSMGYGQTHIGRLIGTGGWWFTVTDAGFGAGSTASVGTVSGESAFSGKSLKTRIKLDSSQPHPWGIVGFFVGRGGPNRYYNLEELEAVSFQAKGSGKVKLRLYSKLLESIQDNTEHFSYEIELSQKWTHYRIPIDSFTIEPGSRPNLQGYTLEQALKSVTTISFLADTPANSSGDTVYLWVDEIYLEGIRLGTLIY